MARDEIFWQVEWAGSKEDHSSEQLSCRLKAGATATDVNCRCWAVHFLISLNRLEKTLESPLDCKEIRSVHSKGDQSWVSIGRTDAKAETPILWPPLVKSWLIGKDPGAGRDWGQEEKGTTEEEMAGWCHWLDGHEFEWTPGVGNGQGGLTCCSPWGHKESDMTEWLNWYWLRVSFIVQKLLSLIRPHLFTFAFISITLGGGS